MSTTLSGGFTMMTQIVKKDDKKKILRTQTLLPFTTFQKIQKRNSSKLIPEADVEKDLLDLCFTGWYKNEGGKRKLLRINYPKLFLINNAL